MNYSNLILVLIAILIVFSGTAFASADTYAVKNVDSTHRYISHAWVTQPDTNTVIYTVNQNYQTKISGVWKSDTSQAITEQFVIKKTGTNTYSEGHNIKVENRQYSMVGYNPMTYTSSLPTAYAYFSEWKSSSNYKHTMLYTTPWPKYYGDIGLIPVRPREASFMVNTYAPTTKIYKGATSGLHYIVGSRTSTGAVNKQLYFTGQVVYQHPATSYEKAVMEASKMLPVFEHYIPDNNMGNVLGQTSYGEHFIIEYRYAGVVYHEMYHQMNPYANEDQCDAYAAYRGFPINY